MIADHFELHLPPSVVLRDTSTIEGSTVFSFQHVSGSEIATLVPSPPSYDDLEDVCTFLRQWVKAFY